MTKSTTKTYLEVLRETAQSVLAGIQRLEELEAEDEDDHWSNAEFNLNNADEAVWSLVDWIADGRESEV